MIQSFSAVNGQSLFDVCLNTYGTTDLLYKLLQDNNISDLDYTPVSGQVFTYDDSLIIDQGIQNFFNQTGVIYATDINIINNGTQGDFNSDFNFDFSIQ
jgi:hypothetical protein